MDPDGHRLLVTGIADKKDEIGVYKDGNWYLDYDGTGSGDLETGIMGLAPPGGYR